MSETVDRKTRSRLDRLVADTVSAKARLDEAKAEYDGVRALLTEVMGTTELDKFETVTGDYIARATVVRSTTKRLDPTILNDLNEDQTEAVTTRVVDQEKLAAAVVLGVVDEAVVEEYTEIVERDPYVRVSVKPV